MNKLLVLAGAGFMLSCGLAVAQSQPNPIQGTPGSLFPDAAPNEVQIINGVPCRTVLIGGSNVRVPVQCAGQVATGTFEPSATGSIRVEEMPGAPAAGMPNPFPYAAPNEIRIINGVPCRTILTEGNVRVPIECAR